MLVVLWAVLFGCAFYRTVGVPCPGCGMTRAWLRLLQGDPAGAFQWHPLFWALPFLAVLACFSHRLSRKTATVLTITAAALFVGVYAVRMAVLFPHTEPMTWNDGAPVRRLFLALGWG